MQKTAIIIGSTGLTGSYLLDILLKSDMYNKVVSFVRKGTGITHEKLQEYIVDFDDPDSYKDMVKGHDLFCCLGTTIKKAGSQAAFERVDLVYPVEFAKIAAENGVLQYLIISSLGANAESGNFYLRTKGKCEEEISATTIPSVSIFRPSLLLGDRKEFRLGEQLSKYLMAFFSLFMFGKLRKYKPVKSQIVANAMYHIAQQNVASTHIYESDDISRLGR